MRHVEFGRDYYILLSGYPPFYGDSDPEIFASVRSGRYSFDTPEWIGVSSEAKDLINNLLQLNPKQRLTSEQTLNHPWLSGSAPETERVVNTNIMNRLKRFTGHNKLKKAALGVIADEMTEHEIQELRNIFCKIDADGNGVITIAELAASVNEMGHGLLETEVRDLLRGVDLDGNGKLDYQEFIAATMKRNQFNKEQYLQNAFNYFDTKKQGVITLADLTELMGSQDHAQEIMDEVDTNKDGTISFEEFVHMMQSRGITESESMSSDSRPMSYSM